MLLVPWCSPFLLAIGMICTVGTWCKLPCHCRGVSNNQEQKTKQDLTNWLNNEKCCILCFSLTVDICIIFFRLIFSIVDRSRIVFEYKPLSPANYLKVKHSNVIWKHYIALIWLNTFWRTETFKIYVYFKLYIWSFLLFFSNFYLFLFL